MPVAEDGTLNTPPSVVWVPRPNGFTATVLAVTTPLFAIKLPLKSVLFPANMLSVPSPTFRITPEPLRLPV